MKTVQTSGMKYEFMPKPTYKTRKKPTSRRK